MDISKQARKAMTAARSSLIMDHPFFAVLVMQLKLVEAPFIPTMAVDGTHLFYNPEFTLKLPERQRIGVIAHEGYHCAWRHHTRMGNRNLEKWNIAGDHVINLDLLDTGFELPDWVLKDPQYKGMSTEEVYAKLPEPPKQPQGGGQGKGQGQGKGKGRQAANGNEQGKGNGPSADQAPDPGQCGGVIPAAASWDHEKIAHEDAKWERIARQAVTAAKQRNAGNVPAYLKRLVTALETPKVNWQAELRHIVDSTVRTDNSWCRPKKRYLSSGFVFPGPVAQGVHKTVSIMDTSGSITQKLINQYAAEHQALLDEEITQELVVIYTDTVVHNTQTFEQGDLVKLDPQGGGGTNFRAVMDHVREHHSDASVILFFTDLIVHDFGEDPDVPLLWLAYGMPHQSYQHRAANVPFGEVVFIGM